MGDLMSKENIIRQVRSLVTEACKQETNIFGFEIWTHHILAVVYYGRELARSRGADEEVVELAALLHDYACIAHGLPAIPEHHRLGAEEAERILSGLSYPPEKIARVKECILTHRGSIPAKRTSVEAQCLADADALAHFDALPSLFRYAYVRAGMGVDEAIEWVRAKLERSWRKLSPEGKELAREKYEACKAVLSQGGMDE
jgi:uncharacterized protein